MKFNILSIEKNLIDKFTHFQSLFQEMTVKTTYNTLLIDSGFQTDMFNLICATGRESRDDVLHSLNYFRKRKLPFCWWAGFENEPEWLQNFLESEGLASSEEETVMATLLEQGAWPEANGVLDVRQVDSQETLDDFLAVVGTIILEGEMREIIEFYHLVERAILKKDALILFFVGYLKEKAVATASIFCSGEIASIFDVIVDPSFRGRGFGKLMTASAMKNAAEKGCQAGALTATDDAKFLYQKLGFQELKLMRVFTET